MCEIRVCQIPCPNKVKKEEQKFWPSDKDNRGFINLIIVQAHCDIFHKYTHSMRAPVSHNLAAQ